MPRANPDKAADTLSGRTDIVWSLSDTVTRTEHTAEAPTVPATVTHTARFAVTPKALPTVQLEYGRVRFWPERVSVTWIDGVLVTVHVYGHQAKKTGDGIGKDERQRTFKRRWASRGEAQPPFDRAKIPAALRDVISRYELKVPVASPSPMVVA